eukprot:TsM_000365000 transcript=TsM_000365000 gene=TsM_000365000
MIAGFTNYPAATTIRSNIPVINTAGLLASTVIIGEQSPGLWGSRVIDKPSESPDEMNCRLSCHKRKAWRCREKDMIMMHFACFNHVYKRNFAPLMRPCSSSTKRLPQNTPLTTYLQTTVNLHSKRLPLKRNDSVISTFDGLDVFSITREAHCPATCSPLIKFLTLTQFSSHCPFFPPPPTSFSFFYSFPFQ